MGPFSFKAFLSNNPSTKIKHSLQKKRKITYGIEENKSHLSISKSLQGTIKI
jgi:hypothetical protein